MARLSKEQALRKAAAAKKRAQREAKKDAGLVEVLLSPEFHTANLLAKVASHLKITVSALVVELVEALPPEGLPHDPRWRTYDYTTADIGLTIPKAIDEKLCAYEPRLSARSVLEQIVLIHCSLVPEDALDHVDALGVGFEPWMVGKALMFDHPTRKDLDYVITGMSHLRAEERALPNGKTYDKYGNRVEARKLAAIRARGGALHDPNDMVDWVNWEGR